MRPVTLEEIGISKAPWTAYPETSQDYAYVESSVPDNYDGFSCVGDGCDTTEDAMMMSAAPDMYEVLVEAMGTCADCEHDCEGCINMNRSWIPKARAAIRKAGGYGKDED